VISGPYTHNNLSIFLIHGADKLKDKTFLTLDEALAQKVAVVYETGEVSELAVENKSPTVYVYVQSGVIVKGGKQDRTIQHDMIVPPRSGKVPVGSFCVESARWSQRGGESAAAFGSASSNLSTKELKLAAKQAGDQQAVWNNVAKAQKELSLNLGSEVASGESRSSLQLTLENDKLRTAAAEYTAALSKVTAGKTDVVGYAFAVNGEINSADIYGSKALFDKLWPSLLNASAVEAIAKQRKGSFAEPTADAVKALIEDAEKGKAVEKNLSDDARMVTQETEKSILFKYRDAKVGPAAVRMEYLAY